MTARLTPGTSGLIEEQHTTCSNAVAVLSFTTMSNHNRSGVVHLKRTRALCVRPHSECPSVGGIPHVHK